MLFKSDTPRQPMLIVCSSSVWTVYMVHKFDSDIALILWMHKTWVMRSSQNGLITDMVSSRIYIYQSVRMVNSFIYKLHRTTTSQQRRVDKIGPWSALIGHSDWRNRHASYRLRRSVRVAVGSFNHRLPFTSQGDAPSTAFDAIDRTLVLQNSIPGRLLRGHNRLYQ